jgi:hypothetical protein
MATAIEKKRSESMKPPFLLGWLKQHAAHLLVTPAQAISNTTGHQDYASCI